MRKITIFFLTIVITVSMTITGFAASQEFEDFTINADSAEWDTYTSETIGDVKSILPLYYENILDMFESGAVLYGLSKDTLLYFYVTPKEIGSDVNFSDYSDDEILEIFSDDSLEGETTPDETASARVENRRVFTINGVKYIVLYYSINTENEMFDSIMYETCIDGTAYIVNCYKFFEPMNNNEKELFEEVVKSIEYSAVASDGSMTEEEAEEYSAFSALIAVVPFLLIIVIFIFIKGRRKKNVVEEDSKEEIISITDSDIGTASSNNLQKDKYPDLPGYIPGPHLKKSDGKLPVEDLRAAKKMYDDGIITDEEYSKIKSKLLNI